VVFGFRLFIGFFVFLDRMRGKEPVKESKSALVIPPYIDPLPLATMSGKLVITGRAQANARVIIYVNGEEIKKVTVKDDGTFTASSVNLPEGTHTIQAKTSDAAGNKSEFSNSVVTTIKKRPPLLSITVPNDNTTITGENNLLTVEGKTDEGNDVRINDRYVVVRPDGFFTYPYPLSEGENILSIRAIDRAGNSTELQRTVTYTK
jgi:hypothetical protein